MGNAPDWIGVDWGTSNLRGWAMRGGTVVGEASSDQGMASLSCPAAFESALMDLIAPFQPAPATPILACGMVGARQGWREAAYLSVPCTPLGAPLQLTAGGHSVHILPGLSQAKPADVMRGEETQIAGFLALNPGWDGVICLPGTHTKWAQVSAGEIVSFQTFMTGELFALLSAQSVLRHSVTEEGWNDTAFAEAVADTLSRPEGLAAKLFAIRASDLLNGTTADVSRARLSGLLLGAELAAARPYWLGTQIAVIGAPALSKRYAEALATQGAPATIADAPRMTLAGLTAAYQTLKEAT